MKKKILVTVIFLITAFSMLMCGCERKHGEFYTLQEAYDNGLLTKENLEEIAYYVNNSLSYPEALDGKIEKKIKNDMAYEIRHAEKAAVKNAKPDGVRVFWYYGEYSDCYIVRLINDYWLLPAGESYNWINIDGVEIHLVNNPPLYVWRDN